MLRSSRSLGEGGPPAATSYGWQASSRFQLRTLLASVLAATVGLVGQGRLDPARLLKPGTDSWPTFNGDYSGRRFSTLTTITNANVHQLSLAWMYRITSGGPALGAIKSTPLQINGVLYFSVPDHVWAVDARSGTRALALPVGDHGRESSREPRRGGLRGLAVLRDAGLLPHLAQPQGRKGAMAEADLRHGQLLLRVRRPRRRQGSRDRRRQRRRLRHSRLLAGASRRERRAAVALVHRAAEDRRSRLGNRGRAKRR